MKTTQVSSLPRYSDTSPEGLKGRPATPRPATETTRTTCVMTRKKDRACDTRAASGPSPGRPRGKSTKAKRTGEPKLGVFEKVPFRVYPKKPLLSPSVTEPPPKKELVTDSMTPWECAACGHEHKLTRRSVHLLAQCARCACVKGDVVHSLRLAGVGPLLAARPFQNEVSFRCFGDALDVTSPTITTNPHAVCGTRLYKRFHKAYTKSTKKEVKVMFHGTSARSAVSICATGMDPHLRLSGGDWFTVDTTYALSRAISREEYAVANANAFGDATVGNLTGIPLAQREELVSLARAPSNTANAPGPWSTLFELETAASQMSRSSKNQHAHAHALPPTHSVRVVAVAVLLDECTAVGDHVVVKNHHHALPLFVVDFKRGAA